MPATSRWSWDCEDGRVYVPQAFNLKGPTNLGAKGPLTYPLLASLGRPECNACTLAAVMGL